MLKQTTIDTLRRKPEVRFYFRYRLRPEDFSELRDAGGRVLGWYTAKPLYDRLTAQGRVDRRGGYSGRLALLFVPPSGEPAARRLLFTRMPPEQVTAHGRRNWPAIRAAAEHALHQALAA